MCLSTDLEKLQVMHQQQLIVELYEYVQKMTGVYMRM